VTGETRHRRHGSIKDNTGQVIESASIDLASTLFSEHPYILLWDKFGHIAS